VTALILLRVPVLAPIVRLESLPLVRALQPLFWTTRVESIRPLMRSTDRPGVWAYPLHRLRPMGSAFNLPNEVPFGSRDFR
jgi:hypothetical protein